MIAVTLCTDFGLGAWPYLSMTWRLELALNKKVCSVIGRLTMRPVRSCLVAQHCPLIFPRVPLVFFCSWIGRGVCSEPLCFVTRFLILDWHALQVLCLSCCWYVWRWTFLSFVLFTHVFPNFQITGFADGFQLIGMPREALGLGASELVWLAPNRSAMAAKMFNIAQPASCATSCVGGVKIKI